MGKSGAGDELRAGGHLSRCRPCPQRSRDNPVTTLKLHYEGWLALPAAFRQKLGLSKDAALEAELVGGTIVLRPTAGLKTPARSETEELGQTAAAAVPVPSAVAATAAKSRGRRKQAAAPVVPSPVPKSRGRRAKPAEGSSAHAS
jgi:antitoxin component of MazEF toxin-antitoxin module